VGFFKFRIPHSALAVGLDKKTKWFILLPMRLDHVQKTALEKAIQNIDGEASHF